MFDFPVGAMLESFKLPFQEAVERAATVGAQGLQIYMSKPTVTYYEDLNEKKIKELLDMIKSNGLVVSAICGDFKLGFSNPETNPMQIERSKRVLDLAKYFETNIVTTHIGTVPTDKNDPTYKIMQDACAELGEYADSIGSSFAIETGPETALVLREFLDSLPSKKGMAVNMDPANLVMVMNDDPVQAVYTLKDYIVHTHAKDGVHFDDPTMEKPFKEMALGQGSVDFPKYLKALEDIGYRGFLTIEREVGGNPAADIGEAVKFLNKVKKEY
ncbi:MAG: sugar phosphate isomerase/epimerase [Clostridia bacterium]|nr:sugar phosphate isomerase/epimerase [Clostridia bacterium]